MPESTENGSSAVRDPELHGIHSQRRIGLVVLGMHRSGTSALTRVLSLLGADLPSRLMGAAGSNETGHWEPQTLVDVNDQLLSEVGGRWDDWRNVDSKSLQERYLHFTNIIADCLQQDYSQSNLFVLKDPRICRLVPLFEDVADHLDIEFRYIIPYRDSTEVAASLSARDGITVDYAKLMWARHILDAEADTRGSSRVFVRYDALLSDFGSVCDRISSSLEIEWPISVADARANIAAFLKPDLRHHQASGDNSPTLGEIAGFAEQVLANLVQLERDAYDEQAMSTLSSLRKELDNPRMKFVDATFGEFATRQKREAESFRLQLDQVRHDANVTAEQLDRARHDANMTAEQLAQAQQSADLKSEQLHQLSMAHEAVNMQLEQCQQKQIQLQNELSATQARAQTLEETLEGTLNSLSWRATRPLRALAGLLGSPRARTEGPRSSEK